MTDCGRDRSEDMEEAASKSSLVPEPAPEDDICSDSDFLGLVGQSWQGSRAID